MHRSRSSSWTAGESATRKTRRTPSPSERRPSWTASRRNIRTPSCRHRASTSACPTGRWATPRSGIRTSAQDASSTRSSRASRRRSPTVRSSRTRRCSMPSRVRRSRAAHCTSSVSFRQAACTATKSTSTGFLKWRSGTASRRSMCMPSSTAVTCLRRARRAILPNSKRNAARSASARSRRSRDVTTPWIATSAGSASRRRMTPSPRETA